MTRTENGRVMTVSWIPLTLEQAHGFVQYYVISLREGGISNQKRQTDSIGCTASDSTCLVSATNDSIAITELDPMKAYTVTVAAANGFGAPPTHPPTEVDDSLLRGEPSEEQTVDGESFVF